MKELLFIYNSHAGKGIAQKELAPILDVFTKAGWLVTAYPTQKKGDATEIAEKLGGKFEQVVCAGGDGTLGETVTGLLRLEKRPVLGYIPLGSTNDCAATLHLPRVPRQAAAIAAGEGVPRPIDIGLMNGQPFVYIAAFGAFTQVAYETPQDLKNALGHLAYVLSGIASLPAISPYHMKVEYDEGNVVEGDFFFGMVANTLSVGGFRLPNNEKVVLDDGLFEVDLIRVPVSLADVADGFQTLLEQNSPNAGARVHFKASHVVFTATKPVPWTIDGEFGGKPEVTEAQNLRQAITIICGS